MGQIRDSKAGYADKNLASSRQASQFSTDHLPVNSNCSVFPLLAFDIIINEQVE